MCCSGTTHGDRRHPAAGPSPPAAPTAREAMRARFPPRPVPDGWPATLQPRDTAWERLTRPPFVLDDAKRQQRRVRGLALLLDWLAAQPGQTWQERWLASGADRAGAGWRQLPAAWLHDLGLHREGRQAELSAALTVAICADLVRPSPGWLVSADARGNGALVRGLARTRDGEGFARLQELCDHDPGVSATAGRQTVHRTALIVAAKGGTVRSITVGDVLELLDAEAATRTGSRATPGVLPAAAPDGDPRRPGAGPAAGIPHPRPAHPRRADRPLRRSSAARSATCWWTTCGSASPRWTTPA